MSRTRAILVVEDDAAMRHLLVELLQAAGFLAGCAAGVEEALALLRLHDFDTVLSDVHVRDRSGFEILGELNAWGRRTRVVLMTAFASQDMVESARAAGATCVLSKPFGEDQLLEALA